MNWSYTQATRIGIPIGVKYGSDLLLVKKVLLDLAAAEPKVLDHLEPYVFCEAYGDSSIDLELSVWIDDQSLHRKIKSELNCAVDLAFKANNIEIPFPQRDLHIKSGLAAVSAKDSV